MTINTNFILAGLLAMICVAFNSCTSDSEVLRNSEELISECDIKYVSEFHNALTANIETMLEKSVVIENYHPAIENITTRAAFENGNNANVTPVLVDTEFVERPQDIKVSSIRSYGDMLELQTKYDAEFEVLECEPVGLQAVIYVSEEETLEALKPLIEQSKNYLYRKGFTDAEIDGMLAENNASPACLIPLTLLLTEDEINTELDKGNLIQECFAFTRGKITLSTVLTCAVSATGLDIISILTGEINNSSVNKWTKKAIKLLFKKVAVRFMGPVGVGLAVISFSSCLYGAYKL